MENSVEVLAIILFGVLGLSHILQPKAWAEFFIVLRGKGEAGAFVDGLLNLPLDTGTKTHCLKGVSRRDPPGRDPEGVG